MTFKIEAGKWYRTRGGQKAFVYAIGRRGSHPVHGYIAYPGDDIDEICNWRDDGRSTEEEQTHRDLVAEWRDEPRRAWANWHEDGRDLVVEVYATKLAAEQDAMQRSAQGWKRLACVEIVEGEGL